MDYKYLNNPYNMQQDNDSISISSKTEMYDNNIQPNSEYSSENEFKSSHDYTYSKTIGLPKKAATGYKTYSSYKGPKFYCQFCSNKKFKTEQYLEDHLRRRHMHLMETYNIKKQRHEKRVKIEEKLAETQAFFENMFNSYKMKNEFDSLQKQIKDLQKSLIDRNNQMMQFQQNANDRANNVTITFNDALKNLSDSQKKHYQLLQRQIDSFKDNFVPNYNNTPYANNYSNKKDNFSNPNNINLNKRHENEFIPNKYYSNSMAKQSYLSKFNKYNTNTIVDNNINNENDNKINMRSKFDLSFNPPKDERKTIESYDLMLSNNEYSVTKNLFIKFYLDFKRRDKAAKTLDDCSEMLM